MDFNEWTKLPASQRIEKVGHRVYTGGANEEMWYGIGKLQYHFLVSQGLRPDDCFLDVACGALRLGQFLIPYLDEGNYQGLDAQSELAEAGLTQELSPEIVKMKRPKFSFNRDFDFSNFQAPDYAIAQSLFTHLLPHDIKLCFRNFLKIAKPTTKFYFTFFDGDSNRNPTDRSHANKNFFYRYEQLEGFAKEEGWTSKLIGNWRHPRNQIMIVSLPTN